MSVKLEEEELQQLYQDAHQSQGRLLRGGKEQCIYERCNMPLPNA
ncbi:hypothetical protein LHA01_27950 [Schleiferilactobacillus harbinensis]|jgi:hypothetical protein|nr:hypothetical protein LHA01_27950 [Schleiferilactobacillus harbinensis]